MITVLDDLKAKLEDFKNNPTDDCIIWPHAKTAFGHGHLVVDGKTAFAHRLAYELYYGEKPEGLVMHSCDNPSCINPHHLEDGTPRQNALDMLSRGRHLGKGVWKLSENDVREIDKLLDKGMKHQDIADLFGVNRVVVTHINTGHSWSHVTGRTCASQPNKARKLNEDKVRQIVELLEQGMILAKIARRFGVSIGTISLIKNGHTWKHLTCGEPKSQWHINHD